MMMEKITAVTTGRSRVVRLREIGYSRMYGRRITRKK